MLENLRTGFLTCLALSLSLACASAQTEPAAPGSTRVPGGIVAIVGDDVITQAELDKRVERKRAQLASRFPASAIDREYSRLERYELERMVEDKLIFQLSKLEEKKGEGPYITEADVDGEINRQVEELKKRGERVKGPEDLYRAARENEGMPRDEYRRNVKERLTINKYLWQKVFKVNDDFVPPQDLKAYYHVHLDEFSTPVEISFHQIKIPPSRDNRMDILVDLVKKGLKENRDFVEIAKEVAELLGDSPDDAGKLWTKTFEDLKGWRKPIPETLRKMKKGEISDMVFTSQDIHVFKVVDVKEGAPKPFEEAQEEISKKIREEQNQNALDAFLARQRKKTRVDVFLPPLPEEKQEKSKDAEKAEKAEKVGAADGGQKPEKTARK